MERINRNEKTIQTLPSLIRRSPYRFDIPVCARQGSLPTGSDEVVVREPTDRLLGTPKQGREEAKADL
jgi:hypothetical protein